MITATAPTRIDLAGGTLDIAPLPRLIANAVTVNLGISLEAKVVIKLNTPDYRITSHDQNQSLSGSFRSLMEAKELPLFTEILRNLWGEELPNFHFDSWAKSPAGAGIGGSSSLLVAACGAVLHLRQRLRNESPGGKEKLVRIAKDIETSIIKVPAGTQDYWGALNGGINIIRFPAGGENIEQLPIDQFEHLRSTLILCYSGVSRQSGINNWDIFKEAFNGNEEVISGLGEIAQDANRVAIALNRRDWYGVIEASRIEWQNRIALWPAIHTNKTQQLAAAAEAAGARLVRVCGAGGGGVLAVFCYPETREAVVSALERAGGEILDASPAEKGLEISGEP